MRRLFAVLLASVLLVPDAFAGAVAVLYFENQGNPGLEPLKVGLAQMLITDLQATPGVDVVERARLQALLDELKLGHDGVTDPATAAKVGKLVGAEYLVLGSYFELMGTLRIDARVVHVETGRIVHAAGSHAPTSNFLSMEKELATSIGASLAGPSASRGTSAPPHADLRASSPAISTTPTTSSPTARPIEAAVAYSEGLMHLDQKDLPRARESFERAVATDPQLEAARAELARLTL